MIVVATPSGYHYNKPKSRMTQPGEIDDTAGCPENDSLPVVAAPNNETAASKPATVLQLRYSSPMMYLSKQSAIARWWQACQLKHLSTTYVKSSPSTTDEKKWRKGYGARREDGGWSLLALRRSMPNDDFYDIRFLSFFYIYL